MKKFTLIFKGMLFLATILLSNIAFSQNQTEKDTTKVQNLDEIVVTGVVSPRAR
jgi:preprotein translocase subunit SecG